MEIFNDSNKELKWAVKLSLFSDGIINLHAVDATSGTFLSTILWVLDSGISFNNNFKITMENFGYDVSDFVDEEGKPKILP